MQKRNGEEEARTSVRSQSRIGTIVCGTEETQSEEGVERWDPGEEVARNKLEGSQILAMRDTYVARRLLRARSIHCVSGAGGDGRTRVNWMLDRVSLHVFFKSPV